MIAEQPSDTIPSAQPIKRKSDRTGAAGLLLTFFLKFAKFFKLAKLVLFTASFATYAVLFSWKFAVLILVSLFVHENGHIWAMKRVGIKTKGIYFIPLFGGAAVAESAFPSRRDEVFVAIMGPIWGLALALGAGALYVATQDPLWAAASGWMAFINLFNLFPLNPLDGGRIVKSVAFSLNSWLGIGVMLAGFLAALVLTFKFGFGLLVFILFIGAAEFFAEVRAHRAGRPGLPGMRLREVLGSLAGYVLLAGVLLGLMLTMQHEPGAGLATQFLRT